MDGRRRRRFVLDAEWPFDPLGMRLAFSEFGNEALAVRGVSARRREAKHQRGSGELHD